MSRIVLGITGGIAAYKAVDLASRLRQQDHAVDVVLTRAAEAFVAPLSFSAVTGRPAYQDRDFWQSGENILHVELAHSAETIIIAPATADFMARAAHGMADSLLGSLLLSARCPVIWAPAMESGMWEHAATQENIARLVALGHRVIPPGEGHLASGRSGVGRMPQVEEILAAVDNALQAPVLRGVRVLVTAGPTREYIDPVRFLSNPSTGRMGIAVAEAARSWGADVTLVLGPTEVRPPGGITVRRVTSSAEMFAAVDGMLQSADVLVATAAVADLRPIQRFERKVKKDELPHAVELEPTQDILAHAGAHRRPGQILVGFAAETDDPETEARRKLQQKNCDLVVGNDVRRVDAGFGVDTNVCTFVTAHGAWQVGPASKREIGEEIMAFVAQRLGR